MRNLEILNDFHGQEDKRLRAIAALHISVEYLEDAVEQYKALAEVLSEEPGIEDVETMVSEIKADGNLASGLRFLEIFKKGTK